MGKSLFLDTSHFLTLGILDENHQWLAYQQYKETKGSGVLHSLIYDQLHQQKVKLFEIENFFQMAGPGSYTGIRLSDSIRQLLDWQKVSTFSFYHFAVPSYLGIQQGRWISYAFKNELFSYSWSVEKTSQELLSLEGGLEDLQNLNLYTHFCSALDFPKIQIQETSKLIFENPQKIFEHVRAAKIQESPYYYRPLNKEFRTVSAR